MGEMKSAHKIFVRKPEGKRPHRRSRHRQEDNVGMVLGKEGGKVWIGFIWLRIRTSGRLL
jgi:hypothetical protein